MPIGKVESIIRQFIADNNNDVLVLKGQWGVGKTYFWHSVIRSEADSLGRESYAYVSLFGLNSLDDLRNAIFASRVQASEIGSNDPLAVLEKNAKGLVKYLKILPKLKDWSAVASSAAFHIVTNTLICLDDLERKGNSLDTREILGLVSLLKEQRNCKIALILNDGSLQGEDRERFQRHGEKLIDIELTFSQTPEEAFKCAFPQGYAYYDTMARHCHKLGITNIRILQRLKRFSDGLAAWYPKCEQAVTDVILHTLALYVWCYYDKDGNAPPLDYVRRYGFNPFGSLEDKDENPQEKKWDTLLHDYGYILTDDLDLQIAEYVQKGYVDEEAFTLVLDKKNAEVRSTKGQEHYRKAWDLYYNTFDNNEADFVKELIASFRANIQYLSPMNLSGAAEILRGLGFGDDADKLVDEYVASRGANAKLFDLSSYSFRGDIRDPYVVQKFEQALANTQETRTLSEVLQRLVENNGWGDEDEIFLSSCPVEEYYEFFKGQNSEELHHYVKRCLEFGTYSNATDRQKAIAKRVRAALGTIARESTINRMRVEKTYGVKVEKAAEDPPE